MQPLLSIVISVYNAEITIKKAITSILTQKFDDWEIILVNDGSTDSCPQIIDDYAKSDTRIKAFHKQNEGPYSGFNLGIEKAIGKYITFMGADDTYELDALQIIANQATEYDYDIICILLNILQSEDDEQNITKILERQVLPQKWENGIKITNKKDFQSFWLIFLYDNIISNNMNVYKASIIKKYKYRAIKYGEDTLFNIDLADDICSVSCHPKPIYNYFYYVNNERLNISMNKYHANSHTILNECYIKCKELLIKWHLNNDTNITTISERRIVHNLPELVHRLYAPNNPNTPEQNIDIVTGYYDDIVFETANHLNWLDKVDNLLFSTIGVIIKENQLKNNFGNPVVRMIVAINNKTISVDEIKLEIANGLLDCCNPYRIGFEAYKTLSTKHTQIADSELLAYLETEQTARKLLFTGNLEQSLDTVIQLFNSKISTPEQYVILALCGYHLGLTEDAKNAVETGLQNFPNYPRLEELQNIINTERRE
ncbi:MAG: glycosyltransferase family 2 protein [Firmicutes bacterium]|nr:glycosyltransferase family 2 protein [Bacillota bacterium]